MNNKELAQKTVDRMIETINTTGYLPWTKHHPDPEVIRIPQYHSEPVEGLDEADYRRRRGDHRRVHRPLQDPAA